MPNRVKFAEELESAADRIGDVSRADLQIILRRAALRIRNTDGLALDSEIEDAVQSTAADLGLSKQDFLRRIIREWLEANTYLPVDLLEEDSETDGEA